MKKEGTGPSRRNLLQGAGLGAITLATGLAGGFALRASAVNGAADGHAGHGSARGVPRAPWDRAAALAEPQIRRSENGALATELRAAYAYKDLGGYRLSLRTYEGGIPGPTLRVKPGDTLRIRLINDLPPNPDSMPDDMTLPHQFNSTNFHFHGGHVRPDALSDNVFRVMAPGESYDIEIAIPADHTAGTCWYHPHKHGSVDVQLTSGMAGALIVEGDFEDIPEIRDAREQVLMLNEVLFDHRGAIETYDTLWPEGVPRFLSVNGQREPVIRLRPGEVRRWRIIHAGHENNLNVALQDHVLNVIAYDGLRRPDMARAKAVLMAPGQRADVLLQAGKPGTYWLQAIANDQGYPSPTGPLAKVIVEGDPVEMTLPATLGGKAPFATISAEEVTNRRELPLSTIEPEFPPGANYQEFTFQICRQSFDPGRVDHRVKLGAVEEWKIINEDTSDHVFHIHTNPFQLVALNDGPVAPDWRDTVIVPRKGSVTIRSRFLDFTGRFVLHCHMMNHEELGMMQIVEVFDAS
ncbi:multicopper oxidase family protein [Ancylobacter sp. Lp-2]|uniref:multicopper oxidase family protein n=1 Tax=Ancylobacter sp. Lp-2 TaxID=2881339 RepID=UPI001E2ED474|nr:multicopper oxidase family protein [Ancylobacter sp. Lp-2]